MKNQSCGHANKVKCSSTSKRVCAHKSRQKTPRLDTYSKSGNVFAPPARQKRLQWEMPLGLDSCIKKFRKHSVFNILAPLSRFSTRRICSREQRKKQLDWLVTNTDITSPANHIRFLLVSANKFAKWKTGFNRSCYRAETNKKFILTVRSLFFS